MSACVWTYWTNFRQALVRAAEERQNQNGTTNPASRTNPPQRPGANTVRICRIQRPGQPPRIIQLRPATGASDSPRSGTIITQTRRPVVQCTRRTTYGQYLAIRCCIFVVVAIAVGIGAIAGAANNSGDSSGMGS